MDNTTVNEEMKAALIFCIPHRNCTWNECAKRFVGGRARGVRRGSVFALQDYLLFAVLLTGRPWEFFEGHNQGPSKQ